MVNQKAVPDKARLFICKLTKLILLLSANSKVCYSNPYQFSKINFLNRTVESFGNEKSFRTAFLNGVREI